MANHIILKVKQLEFIGKLYFGGQGHKNQLNPLLLTGNPENRIHFDQSVQCVCVSVRQ